MLFYLVSLNNSFVYSITTDWLNQFWQFSFKTAKAWGRGPQVWNASNLRFDEFATRMVGSLPGTPAMNIDPSEHYPRRRSHQEESPNSSNVPKPSALCFWSIHIREIRYERIKSPEPADDVLDPDDESSWNTWGKEENISDFAERLQENLESNEFSTIKSRDLPISSTQIARAAKRSPEQIMEEAFGFSIMARNILLISDMMGNIDGGIGFSLHELFPLHLASSYLDGSKTCCTVFNEIVEGMTAGDASVRKLYVNHLNHTVLDNLMMSILKAHSSCTPVMVDEAFKKEHRFAGEEVDICGRWDADSDCIRQLHASGIPTIPQNWKHMFCHTSAQAITHCIGTLFKPGWGPDINTPSGLFLKRCHNETCGLKLQLQPLHTLVLTSVYLAQLGRDGENLFGMVACLLCLLGNGANPLLKANVSLKALLSTEDTQHCSHSEFDPLELAQNVPWDLISKWPEERKTGWRIFCQIIKLSQDEWKPPCPKPTASTSRTVKDDFQSIYSVLVDAGDEDMAVPDLSPMDIDVQSEKGEKGKGRSEEMDEDEDEDLDNNEEGIPGYCDDHDEDGTPYQQNFFGKNKNLAALWAAVQTELLTYRRLAEGDPWISPNFDMKNVLECLETGQYLSIDLVSKGMMNPFCRCGIFRHSEDPACLRVEEVCTDYFSNLEDFSRTHLLEAFYDRPERWNYEM